MPETLSEPPSPAAVLPMLLFLRLADGDGRMTAYEMERFDALLAKRDWCRSALVRQSLELTEAEKSRLWKQHIAGQLGDGRAEIAASLDAFLRSSPAADRPDIEADLLHFCRELLRAARGGGLLPKRDPLAKATFAELQDLLMRPSASAAPKPIKTPPARLAALPVETAGSDVAWQSGKLTLRCIQTVQETQDVKTFRFVHEPAKLFRYRPGQFITLDCPVDGKIVRRSYTISSSPSRPYVIAVTVKRVDAGRISNWLHDTLSVGDELAADGPHGKFTCAGDPEASHLFISGGSGVTPLMAMSRWLFDMAPDVDIHFLHFARTADDLIFAHELRLMERQMPGFRCSFVCSRSPPDGSWSGPTGRISPELLAEIVPDLSDRSVYLCGPVPFMETARGIVEQLGFDMARFKQESFGGAPRTAPATGAPTAPAAVVFAKSGLERACGSSDFILDVALEAGVDAKFSCRSGQCGTCKALLVEGAVEHDCADGLTEQDAADGFILLCQAHPKGRVVVSL